MRNPRDDKSIIIHLPWLAHTRERIKTKEPKALALKALLLELADEALEAPLESVTDKPLTPPSGDKRDYLSLGPYWWPDPDQPDGKPYIRRDGEVNPESASDATDRFRLGRMAGHVRALCLAYYITQDQRYAKRAGTFMRHWFLDETYGMTPHLNFGQAIPGRVEGRGIGIIDTVIFMKITEVEPLLHSSDEWTASDRKSLRHWFSTFVDWLLTSEHGIEERDTHNNHGTWYDAQVVSYAQFCNRPDVAKQVLSQVVATRINAHIEPDGTQPHELARTLSFSYSVMNLQGHLYLAWQAKHYGIDMFLADKPDGSRLYSALIFMSQFCDANVTWPYQQIKPIRYSSLYNIIAVAYHAYDDERFYEAINALPGDTAVILDRILCPVAQ